MVNPQKTMNQITDDHIKIKMKNNKIETMQSSKYSSLSGFNVY